MYPANSWLAEVISSCGSVITLSFVGKPAETPGNHLARPRNSPLHNPPGEKSRADCFQLPVFTPGYANSPLLEVREQGRSSLCNVHSIQLMSTHARTHTHALSHFICGRTRVISVFLPRRSSNTSACLANYHSHTSLCRAQPPRAMISGTYFADLKSISQLQKKKKKKKIPKLETE